MPAIVLAVIVLAACALGYRYYLEYLAEQVHTLDEESVTPAHEFRGGIDFVPTNNEVSLGHHLTSVAGAPIVGPTIAVIWGGAGAGAGGARHDFRLGGARLWRTSSPPGSTWRS